MKTKLEKIASYIAKHSSADDYTLNIHVEDKHETRFAQNAITQHMAGENMTIYLESAFENKTGSASTNQSDAAALDHLIKSAEGMAKVNFPDAEYMQSESAKQIPSLPGASDATKHLNPEKMVDIVKAVITNAKQKNAAVSGMTEKHYSQHLTATKNGFFGFYDQSEFAHSMTMKKDAVETKVSYSGKDYASFKLRDQIAQINQQFDSLGTPQSFEAQKIAVILRPAALMDYLGFLGWMMDRRMADEGMTAFTDQLGKSFFGEKFSLASLISDPQLSCEPFSSEGLISDETWWVKDGVLQEMPMDRYWAKKIGQNTAKQMYNIYIPGASSSEEEMMQMVPRGLIINRFWYIRFVDRKTGELTGMTRDGVLYFEGGKVRHAVNNLRFNEMPHGMTQKIVAMGASVLCESFMKLPTMLVDDFNFVDKTSF